MYTIASSRRRFRSRDSVSQYPLPTPLHPPSKLQETETRDGKGIFDISWDWWQDLTSPRHNARAHPSIQLMAHANQLTRVAGSAKVPPPSHPITPPCSHANSLGFAAYRACMHRQDGISRFSVPDPLRLGSGHLPPRRMASQLVPDVVPRSGPRHLALPDT